MTQLQNWLTRFLKALHLDEAAILYIMLALKEEQGQEEILNYLMENHRELEMMPKKEMQEKLMMLATKASGGTVE